MFGNCYAVGPAPAGTPRRVGPGNPGVVRCPAVTGRRFRRAWPRLAAVRRQAAPAAAILLCAIGTAACGAVPDGPPAPVESGGDPGVPEPSAPAAGTVDREAGATAGSTAGAGEPVAAVPEPLQTARIPPAEDPFVLPPSRRPIAQDGLLRVGVLLPLSGSRAGTGRELFRSIEMALFEIGADHLELLPRDTAGDAATARTAFLELVGEGVGLVIGPLFAWTTEVVVSEAAVRGIPVLALSNDVSVAGQEAWMLGIHPQGEVRRILRHAIVAPDRGVGLVAPVSEYGDAVIEAYRTEVPPAQQSGVVRYHETSEPAAIVQQFVAAAPGVANRSGDAILIAARGATLRAIAAELAYRNVDPDRVRYLGLSSWRTSDLEGEPALEGGRFAALSEDRFRSFAGRFQRVYGAPPSRTAALAYDAAAIAGSLSAVEPGERIARLQAPRGYRGLLGAFRLLPGGGVERRFNIYEIRRNGYSLFEAAPPGFARAPSG